MISQERSNIEVNYYRVLTEYAASIGTKMDDLECMILNDRLTRWALFAV